VRPEFPNWGATLCRLTLWAKWAIAQGPALKGAPHLLKGLLKIKEKGGKKKKKKKSKREKRKKGEKRGKKCKKEIK